MNVLRKKLGFIIIPMKGKLNSKLLASKRMFASFNFRDYSTGYNKSQPKADKTRQKPKTKSKVQANLHNKKAKFVKPIDVGAYSAHVEPLIQLENGYYLLYYHRQRSYTMLLLYMKLIIPTLALIYLVKKNPFYKSYPIALPCMFVLLIFLGYKFMRFGQVTNRMVHQILIDPSGTEVTFVYKNRFARKLRNDNLEETLLVQALNNPPQGEEYIPIKPGLVFPEKYPFEFERIREVGYFWLKYYISQHMFFALAKRPHYVNYEVLCNVFATKSIDFSQANVYKLMTSKLNKFQLEFMLESLNQYSHLNFAKRQERAQKLDKIVKEYGVEPEPKPDPLEQNKTYERIMKESTSKRKPHN